jgi:hypothetical protein
MLFTFVVCGFCLLFFGDWALELIRSKTPLLSEIYIAVILLISWLETNHSMAGNMLLTKNEVPFFKASIISGVGTLILLFIFFKYTNFGIWSMILAPGIVQVLYQNWKWPLVVIKELKN